MIHYPAATTGADTPEKARMAAAALLVGADLGDLLSDKVPVVVSGHAKIGGVPPESHQSIEMLTDALTEPLAACAALASLFLSRDTEIRAKQFELIAAAKLEGLVSEFGVLEGRVSAMPANQRLALVEMACAAVRQLSYPQYQNYKLLLKALIRADSVIELNEWVLFHLILHYVEPEFVRSASRSPKYRRLRQVHKQMVCVLSLLAHMGRGDPELAFAAAIADLELQDARLLPLAQCSVADFSKAVDDLGLLFPLLKPRALKAMSIAARCDDEISPLERELIYAVAAVMDCPVPSLELATD
jgi:hypothetical protein